MAMLLENVLLKVWLSHLHEIRNNFGKTRRKLADVAQSQTLHIQNHVDTSNLRSRFNHRDF